jgi:histone acetyltransferase (RNA polymerase elongator complex component)
MRRHPPVYPVFLPYAGCPFRCVYCDQPAVTAKDHHQPVLHQAIRQMTLLADCVRNGGERGEVAFYGGTFTALPSDILTHLLELAADHVEKDLFTGIRCSTRPDCLPEHVLGLLSKYPVTTVELGIQSLSETVLHNSGRGYSREQALEACRIVQENHWDLGVQLMVGLPADSPRGFLATVCETIALGPRFVRLYPLLVFPGTELAKWTAMGQYRPLTLEQALDWCVPAFDACTQAGVPIARLGLMLPGGMDPGPAMVAGPWHPALGQLVRNAWWRRRIDAVLGEASFPLAECSLIIRVGERFVSDVVGLKRQNLRHWQDRWGLRKMRVEPTQNDDVRDLAIVFDISSKPPGPVRCR